MSTDALVTHVVAGIAVIIALGSVLGAAARRLGQPEVIGQILAGIALGPTLLGRLPGHLSARLFPSAVVPCLTVVSQTALVLFLFAVGYELDLRTLRRQAHVVPVVAAAAFAAPMLLGGGSAAVFGSLYPAGSSGATHHTAFVLYIAVAMSITAVPVLAGILAERGIAATRPGVIAMAAAGLIDAVGWLALTAAVLLGGASAAGHRPLPNTLLLFGLYLLVMLLVVRPALLRWLRRPGALTRNDVPVIMAVALGSAWATAALGLHVVFGAFLAGVVTPRTADGAADVDLVRPLQQAGGLLLPLFFVVSGLSVNLTAMHASDLGLLLIVCAVAAAGKILGAGFGARSVGLTWRDSAVVGVMLNTRGLTELIVLNIGLQEGFIGARLYTVLVAMALVTTVLTGPLLGLLRFTAAAEQAAVPAVPAQARL